MTHRALLLLMLLGAACSGKAGTAALATTDSVSWRKPGDVVDSIFPMAEYERRFRIGTDSTATIASSIGSRDALARTFLAALARGDTATLASLAISRSEFAWVIFPDHRYAAPPYELDPALFWRQITQANSKGISRALQRHRGKTLAFIALSCQRDTLQMLHGPTALWGPCSMKYRVNDSTVTRQLFGTIVERSGKMKFLSYANDF
ncbi:MAG: hypothetical protein ABIZ70_00895 [Gemmatimonadales bacterium]